MPAEPTDLVARAAALLSPRYAEPHRAYHNSDHINALLRLLDTHATLARDPQAIQLTIWFHDAIYDPTREDNEARSAALARDTLTAWGADAALIDPVVRQVMATAGHRWEDADPDSALFLDLDLSVLASPPEAYDRYAKQIAQEYGWVPEAAYRAARQAVLGRFLARPQLYYTAALRAQWEAPARANLQRERAVLSGAN